MQWLFFALFSAIFAALTSILAKIGIDGVNSNLATAIRTIVVVLMAWGMVFLTNSQHGITDISRRSWVRHQMWSQWTNSVWYSLLSWLFSFYMKISQSSPCLAVH